MSDVAGHPFKFAQFMEDDSERQVAIFCSLIQGKSPTSASAEQPTAINEWQTSHHSSPFPPAAFPPLIPPPAGRFRRIFVLDVHHGWAAGLTRTMRSTPSTGAHDERNFHEIDGPEYLLRGNGLLLSPIPGSHL